MRQQCPRLRALWVTCWCYLLCGWSSFICGLAVAGLAQEIVLKAWTIGPDDPSVYRATNLHTAAERLETTVTEAIRAVPTHRLTPPEAVQFVTTRLRQQLRNQVRIVD